MEGGDVKSEYTKKKQKNGKNKRRFSDEQIRLLESIFESETRLEPRKKLQLAGELGLQPRQIAIWFQNKRARWKSKQIEQDYRTLRANYEQLASCFNSLKNERQSLIIQLQKLNKLLGQPCEEGHRLHRDLEERNTAIATVNYGNLNSTDIEAKQGLQKTKIICSPDIKGRDIVDECTDASLVSTVQLYRMDSGSHFELTSSSSQWFKFWT